MAIDLELLSPRLAMLVESLRAGDSGALDLFCHDLTQHGTPLVEVNDDSNAVLVTFLWYAQAPVEQVSLLCAPLAPQYSPLTPLPLARLYTTDLWYRTERIRADLRALYRFVVNDAPAQPDPWNPLTYHYPKDETLPDSQDIVVSMFALPAAAPQPWLTPPLEGIRGNVECIHLASMILANERRVWVYTPPQYSTDQAPYACLILFDGWMYANVMQAPVTLDNLIRAGKLPPLVCVMVDHLNRQQELGCSPAFADFIVLELLPWARRHYQLSADTALTLIGGASAGGLAAVYTALRYPQYFDHVLAQSGAFWWSPRDQPEPEWLARQVVMQPPQALHVYLEAGLLEDEVGASGVSILTSVRHLRNLLQAKGYRVEYAEFVGTHDVIHWQGTFATGLVALVGPIHH
jgi:enterochelin esterase-like enzyme